MAEQGSRRRKGSRWLGFVLIAAAAILAPLSAFWLAMTMITLAFGPPAWLAPLSLFGVALSVVLLALGYMLAAGRKRLLLFLRRFGNEALNDALRDLVQTRLRRDYRLVTLDDSVFRPIGPRWRGLLVSLAPSIGICTAVGLSFAGYYRVAWSELSDESPFGEGLMMVLVLMLLGAGVAAAAGVILTLGAVRAHFTARRRIFDTKSRKRVVKGLRRLGSLRRAPSIAASMATVVNTADDQWQDAVVDIARIASVTLIDISTPRESICWEVETLQARGAELLLLADRAALSDWWGAADRNDLPPCAAQLEQLASGLPLIVYDSPEQIEHTGLAAQLQDALNRPAMPAGVDT